MSPARFASHTSLPWAIALALVVALSGGCRPSFRAAPASALTPVAEAQPVTSAHAIDPQNVSSLKQVAQWGKGRRTGFAQAAAADRVAVATPLGVYIYRAADLSEAGLVEADPRIDRIALSPSATLLASTQMPVNGVMLQRVQDSATLHRLPDSGYRIDGLAFSPDEEHLAYVSTMRTTAGGRTVIVRAVKLWHAASGEEVAVLQSESETATVMSPVFSPDGRWLVAPVVDERSSWLLSWDLETGAESNVEAPRPGDLLRSVAFSPDGTLAAALASAADGKDSVYLWRTEDWTLGERLELPARAGLGTVLFSPEGDRLAIAGSGQTLVHLWTREPAGSNGSDWRYADLPAGSDGPDRVRALAFTPDGRHLAVATDRALQRWDVEDARRSSWDDASYREASSLAAASPVAWLSFTPGGLHLLGADESGVLWLRDAATGQVVATVAGHLDQGVNDVALVHGENKVIAGASDGRIRLWDVDDDETSELLAMAGGSVDAISLSADGARLAAALSKSLGAEEWDDRVQIWNWSQREMVHELEPPHAQEPVATCSVFRNDVAFSPDGSLVASLSFDHYVHTWQAGGGALAEQLDGHDLVAVDVDFAPDGRHLASASSDGTVRIWHSQGGKRVHTLEGHFAGATGVAYSPDGSLLATSDATGQVMIWRADNGEKLHTLQGQKNNATNLEFSPGGRLLAAGGNEGVILFWDTETWRPAYTLPAHRSTVNAVRFSANGDLLATGSADGTIRLWALPSAYHSSPSRHSVESGALMSSAGVLASP